MPGLGGLHRFPGKNPAPAMAPQMSAAGPSAAQSPRSQSRGFQVPGSPGVSRPPGSLFLTGRPRPQAPCSSFGRPKHRQGHLARPYLPKASPLEQQWKAPRATSRPPPSQPQPPGLTGWSPLPSSQPQDPDRGRDPGPACCSEDPVERAAGWACGRVPPGTSSPSRARARAASVGSQEGRAHGAPVRNQYSWTTAPPPEEIRF